LLVASYSYYSSVSLPGSISPAWIESSNEKSLSEIIYWLPSYSAYNQSDTNIRAINITSGQSLPNINYQRDSARFNYTSGIRPFVVRSIGATLVVYDGDNDGIIQISAANGSWIGRWRDVLYAEDGLAIDRINNRILVFSYNNVSAVLSLQLRYLTNGSIIATIPVNIYIGLNIAFNQYSGNYLVTNPQLKNIVEYNGSNLTVVRTISLTTFNIGPKNLVVDEFGTIIILTDTGRLCLYYTNRTLACITSPATLTSDGLFGMLTQRLNGDIIAVSSASPGSSAGRLVIFQKSLPPSPFSSSSSSSPVIGVNSSTGELFYSSTGFPTNFFVNAANSQFAGSSSMPLTLSMPVIMTTFIIFIHSLIFILFFGY